MEPDPDTVEPDRAPGYLILTPPLAWVTAEAVAVVESVAGRSGVILFDPQMCDGPVDDDD